MKKTIIILILISMIGVILVNAEANITAGNLNVLNGNATIFGNVGIGGYHPYNYGFYANSSTTNTVAIFESTDALAYISFKDDSTHGYQSVLIGAVGDEFNIQTNGTNRFRIDSEGNVGIGTANPHNDLEIYDPVNAQIEMNGTSNSAIIFYDNNIRTGFLSTDNNYMNIGGYDGLDVSIRNGTQQVLTMDGATERIGIGTLSPTHKLDVRGTGNFTKLLTNNLTIKNTSFVQLENSDWVDGVTLGIMQNNPPGSTIPHFVLQSGGGTQASYIMRSFMIVNEETDFFNTTNRTHCGLYMTHIGEELKIDCNTTTTGADLLVSDDMQVVGDVWLKDTDGEWHFMTRSLTLQDELYDNLLLSRSNISIVGNNFNITEHNRDSIIINVDNTETIKTVSSEEVAIINGTNEVPILNIITYDSSGALTRTATLPTGKYANVGRFLIGNLDNVYGSLGGRSAVDEFVSGSYIRLFKTGMLYESGFLPVVDTTNISIGSGVSTLLLDSHSHSIDLDLINNGSFLVESGGSHLQFNAISSIQNYADGGAITANKYYNLVCGILHNDIGHPRMMCVVSNEPATEYNSVVTAEADQYDSLNIFPSNAFQKNLFLPVARLIIQHNTDEFETLSNGGRYIDIRGVTTTAGAPAAPGITDHGGLEGLGDDDHDGIYYTETEINNNLTDQDECSEIIGCVENAVKNNTNVIFSNATISNNLKVIKNITMGDKLKVGTYGTILSGLNGDAEQSISLTSTQSVDMFGSATGYINFYNAATWVAIVRLSDGRFKIKGDFELDGGGDIGTAADGDLMQLADNSVIINGALSATSISSAFTGALTGNAATASALLANGANCAAGSYALGVDASGAVESCTDATTEINTALATQDACSEITNCVANAWDADGDIAIDTISESKIIFGTACAAGNHYYLNGNDLACEADDDTTYDNSTGISLVGTTFSLFWKDVIEGVGNWSADKSNYWDTSDDIDSVIIADEISESNIAFDTECDAGYHYYLNGNDLACEADDYNSAFDTEDEIEAAIFDTDNTAILGMNGYNITNVKGISFNEDSSNHKIYDNATCVKIKGDTVTFNIC